jgi:hypothetical protein
LANDIKTKHFYPLGAPVAVRKSLFGSEISSSTSWITATVSEHDMVGEVFKQRGKALYRNQIPDDVYLGLCATYLPGIFFFP